MNDYFNRDSNHENSKINYTVNIQMITFILTTMVIIMTLLYFIRIYTQQKTEILYDMQQESDLLKSVIEDHVSYAKYFINIIGRTIHKRPEDLDHIDNTLKVHFKAQDFSKLFGWRKYSWVDQNFHEIVTSTRGAEPNPRQLSFIKNMVSEIDFNNTDKHKIAFSMSKDPNKERSLKLVDHLIDKKNNKYLGSVVLSYDIETMVRNLNNRKKKNSTNFVIIDDDLTVIARSKHSIDNILNDEKSLTKHLQKVLKDITFNNENNEDIYYLDMANGLNYFVKTMPHLPFNIIVNIDTNFIRKNILDSVTKKFVEVSLVAAICLFIVISIYKRETALREKAENATNHANRAAQAKTDFLAFTAHEIRSPLGFILTGSEMMTKELLGPLPKDYMNYAKGIHNNSHVILDFITDILDENQIIEGHFKIVNSIADLEEIIDESCKVNIARYNNKNIKFITKYTKATPSIICDKRRILQVFNNLISNAIKYSRSDATISIITSLVSDGLEIQIIDKGIGMKQEEVSVALSLYGTLHKSSKHVVGSYGLGLPIVKMLLDAHDASLKIISKEGVGTTVKITFPKYKLVYKGKKIK